MMGTHNNDLLKVTKCEIIQLLCFDLGKRLNLTKIHENIINEPWVNSSCYGQAKNFERKDLLHLYSEMEEWWSDDFREKKKFFRITLKPFFIKFPKDRKKHKMEIVFTVYQTGFASIALWMHYHGRGLYIDDILAYDDGEMPLTYVFPIEIPNTSKNKMTSLSFQDTLRVFLHNKIMGTVINTVEKLKKELREKSTVPYSYYVILETEPNFESTDELVKNFPLQMAGLLDKATSEWKYEVKDEASRRLKEAISFTMYERFYVG